MNEIVLQTNKLTKQYKNIKAVDNLSFTIKKGVVFGLLGPNGSGKTTTLGIILSVINQTSGDFIWFGKGNSNIQRKRIGAILEGPHFYENFTAYKNLKLVSMIKGSDESDIERVLKEVNLFHRKDDKFKTYSLGMKQRLAIASALLTNPDVLILDEPTNGLDPQGIADIRELIINIASTGKTIILASHLLDEVEKVCDEYLVLKEGNAVYQGMVEEKSSSNLIIELSSLNMELLESVIKNISGFISLKHNKNTLEVKFSNETDFKYIAQFLFENKVVITHFLVIKNNLEAQFLEILEKNV